MRSTEPMSGLNPDAIDEGVSGVSYPPNLADAKEEQPNRFVLKQYNMQIKRGIVGVCAVVIRHDPSLNY